MMGSLGHPNMGALPLNCPRLFTPTVAPQHRTVGCWSLRFRDDSDPPSTRQPGSQHHRRVRYPALIGLRLAGFQLAAQAFRPTKHLGQMPEPTLTLQHRCHCPSRPQSVWLRIPSSSYAGRWPIAPPTPVGLLSAPYQIDAWSTGLQLVPPQPQRGSSVRLQPALI
jgi:hypothetical protein